jgi:outer membrane protein assembly factor BamB
VVSVTPPLGSKSAPPPVVSPSIAPGPAMARPSSTAAPVAAAAAVEDKSIVVTAVSGKLVGLDARSGSVVWEHAIDNGTPMLLIGQGLVLAAVGQSLYCCDYKTGRPMWRAALSAYAARITMIFEGEHVYAFGAGVVDAFDRVGRRVWTRPILPGANASGAIGVPGNVSQADRE